MSDTNTKKWVMVTGGTRGIGKDIVIHLAEKYRVIFTYKSSTKEAQEVVEHCKKHKLSEVIAIQCDGCDESSVEKNCKQLIEKHGSPYALINNAGITRDSLLLKMESKAWHEVIDNNLNATFYWTKNLLSSMVENGEGVIIMMSSVSGIKGNIGQVNYSVTKAALLGFTKSLSLEVARFGIRVNAVLPGIIATDMFQTMPEKEQQKLLKNVPLKTAGNVNDVSQMIDFLISDKSAYITGQSFIVDGGMTV